MKKTILFNSMFLFLFGPRCNTYGRRIEPTNKIMLNRGAAMTKLATIVLITALLAGCATPISKKDRTPVFGGQAPAKIAIAVVDHRTFILSGDKEEWFEGIMRGGFGIPHSLKRPVNLKENPFLFTWRPC